MVENIVNKSSSQKRRRVIVLALYIVLLLWFGSAFTLFNLAPNNAEDEIPGSLFLFYIGVFMIVAVVDTIIFHALRNSIQNVADKEDHNIDERQRTVRDSAYRLAYQIVTIGLLSVLLYAQLASGFQWWLPLPSEEMLPSTIGMVFTLVLILTVTLPTSIVAWNEPDLEPDE